MSNTKNSETTLAVVVTYNRRELLRRCILFLKKQSNLNLEILVVINGSTDGTKEMLKEFNLISIEQENLGSAGGFQRGIDFACKYNYKYCWLMDDDGYPHFQALDKLISHFDQGISCCASSVMSEYNKTKFVFPYPKLNKRLCPRLFSINRKYFNLSDFKKYDYKTYPYAHFFNGALIRVSALKEVGGIEKKFLLYGDELDYFYRLKKTGKVITVLDAFHYHPDVKNRPLSNLKIFCYLRNSMIINKKYLDRVFIRNFLIILVLIYRLIKRNGMLKLIKLLFCIESNFFYLAIYKGLTGDLELKNKKELIFDKNN